MKHALLIAAATVCTALAVCAICSLRSGHADDGYGETIGLLLESKDNLCAKQIDVDGDGTDELFFSATDKISGRVSCGIINGGGVASVTLPQDVDPLIPCGLYEEDRVYYVGCHRSDGLIYLIEAAALCDGRADDPEACRIILASDLTEGSGLRLVFSVFIPDSGEEYSNFENIKSGANAPRKNNLLQEVTS